MHIGQPQPSTGSTSPSTFRPANRQWAYPLRAIRDSHRIRKSQHEVDAFLASVESNPKICQTQLRLNCAGLISQMIKDPQGNARLLSTLESKIKDSYRPQDLLEVLGELRNLKLRTDDCDVNRHMVVFDTFKLGLESESTINRFFYKYQHHQSQEAVRARSRWSQDPYLSGFSPKEGPVLTSPWVDPIQYIHDRKRTNKLSSEVSRMLARVSANPSLHEIDLRFNCLGLLSQLIKHPEQRSNLAKILKVQIIESKLQDHELLHKVIKDLVQFRSNAIPSHGNRISIAPDHYQTSYGLKTDIKNFLTNGKCPHKVKYVEAYTKWRKDPYLQHPEGSLPTSHVRSTRRGVNFHGGCSPELEDLVNGLAPAVEGIGEMISFAGTLISEN